MMGLRNSWVLGDSDLNSMTEVMREMMSPYRSGGGYFFWQLHWVFELITWILIVALLVALVRWIWKKGDRG